MASFKWPITMTKSKQKVEPKRVIAKKVMMSMNHSCYLRLFGVWDQLNSVGIEELYKNVLGVTGMTMTSKDQELGFGQTPGDRNWFQGSPGALGIWGQGSSLYCLLYHPGMSATLPFSVSFPSSSKRPMSATWNLLSSLYSFSCVSDRVPAYWCYSQFLIPFMTLICLDSSWHYCIFHLNFSCHW